MDIHSAQQRSPRKAVDSAVAVNSSSSKQQLHAGSAKLGLSPADLRDRPLKQDGKKLLIHSDSGYISPTVAPASNGNSPQTPSKEPLKVTFQTGTIVGEEPSKSKSEVGWSTGQESIERQEILNRKADNMQRVLVSGVPSSRESRVEQIQRSLAAESPMEEHHFLQDDLLLLAYECRQSNMGTWASCLHPYCVFIRQMSQHFNTYRNSHNHTCEKCSNWADMLTRHMNTCKDAHCPIQMCRNSRNQHQTSTMAQFQFGSGGNQSRGGNQSENSSHRSTHHPLQVLGRSSSFTSADADDRFSVSSLLSNPVISSLARASLRAKAEEIVNRLEREEPFSSDLASLPSSLSQQIPPVPPHSLPTHQGMSDSAHYHAQIGVQQQMMLSPIAEQPGTEDVSPGYSSIHPSLSHVGSQPQFPSLGSGFSSYELDGPGHISIGGASVPAQSMNLGAEKSTESEEPCVVYPKQKVIHQLNTEYLTPGQDGCYYKIRDYNLNDVDLLGVGGFGSCMCAQDITTTKMFAIKQNKNENYKSIEDECFVLSLIPHHDNVVHFLGAVIDERELATQPPLMYKMMMELADNGDLTELFKDEYGVEAPLPEDQSLYYLQQILRGVNFLHQKGFLHLDIKAKNVLVFDGGRTVKLTDFGSAVQVGEAKAMNKGWTPYFVAPEVVRGDVPQFSADIWSTLCILIEMLTTKWPGCHRNAAMTDLAMMFLIGNYENDHIQKLLPLDDLNIQPEVRQLFLDVFVKEPSNRPTALDLLQRPIIHDAEEYGVYFDEYNYDSEDSEEMDSASAKAPDYTSLEHGVPEASHISMAGSNHSMSSIGDKVGELPCFADSQNTKRGRGVSQDSGVGTDMEGSFDSSVVYGAQLSARSLSSGSSNQPRFMYQDSGLEEMVGHECSQSERSPAAGYFTGRQHSSSLNRPNGYVNLNFSSLPPVPSMQTPEYTVVQRSFSFSGRTCKRSESCSRSQTRAMSGLSHIAKRQRPNSIHPKLHLTHSQSAPSIGMDPWRRRHSLQHLDSYGTGETWETDTEVDGVNPTGKPLLRRTSSEVYVDRGPDIDTPEKERNRLQELLSNLTISSTHSPKRSAPRPTPSTTRQTSDAGIQCDTRSATSSLSSTSTASNDNTDTKKDGERDDDPPPSNGSQAFQIC